MSSSIFEKIIKKELPADLLYEDEQAIAIKDIQPAAPFHILVIPKRQMTNLNDVSPETDALLGHCLRIGQNLAKKQGYIDFRTVLNTGANAGQSVFWLHIHVLAGGAGTNCGLNAMTE